MEMINTRFNTANLAALGPLLLAFLLEADAHWAWGFGDKFLTAGVMLFMWLVTSITPDKGFIYKPEAANPNLKAVVVLPLLLMLAVVLSSCSMVPYYTQFKQVADTGLAAAVADRKEFNDKKLALNLAVLCDSSIGAVNRYPNAEVREFIDRLCGGDPGITADQLSRVARLLEQAEGGKPKEDMLVGVPTEPLEVPEGDLP